MAKRGMARAARMPITTTITNPAATTPITIPAVLLPEPERPAVVRDSTSRRSGKPHCGQTTAVSDTWAPQSGQLTIAMGGAREGDGRRSGRQHAQRENGDVAEKHERDEQPHDRLRFP